MKTNTRPKTKKAHTDRVQAAFNRVVAGRAVDIMHIPTIFDAGDSAIAAGADDVALDKAIDEAVTRCIADE